MHEQGSRPVGAMKRILLEEAVMAANLACDRTVCGPRPQSPDGNEAAERPHQPLLSGYLEDELARRQPSVREALEQELVVLGQAEAAAIEPREPGAVEVGALAKLGEHRRASPARLVEGERHGRRILLPELGALPQ